MWCTKAPHPLIRTEGTELNHLSLRIGAVTAGAVLASSIAAPAATAATSLTLTPNVTTVVTLNHGARIAASGPRAGVLTQRLANATFGIEVDSDVYKLRLVFDSYTPPAGVSIGLPTAFLWYNQDHNTNLDVPTSGWTPLLATGVSTTSDDSDDPSKHTLGGPGRNDDPIYLTARFPGTYRFHFVDPGHAGGTDDDVRSESVTMEVRDVNNMTGSALTDDWQPAVTAPAYVGVTRSLTSKVDLSGLTLKDSRGSNGGVGVLNESIAKLVGVKWVSAASGDALDNDVRLAGTTPFVDYSCFGTPRCVEWVDMNATVWTRPAGSPWPVPAVNVAGATLHPVAAAGAVRPDGTRTIPAVTRGVDTLRHVGTVRTLAFLDRSGAGLQDWTWNHRGTALLYLEQKPSVADTKVLNNVPDVVTMSVTPTALAGSGRVTVSGVVEGSSTVTIKGTNGDVIDTVNAAPETGAYSTEVALDRTTTLRAVTANGASDKVTVTVTTKITQMKVVRKGKTIVATAKVSPVGARVSVRVNGTYLRSGYSSRTTGMVKFTIKVKSATKRYQVKLTAKAAGTTASSAQRTA